MRKLLLLTGAAALAIAMPAAAEKGGKGGGKGQGGGNAAQVHHGGGKPAHAGGGKKAGGGHAVHASKPAKAERQAQRASKQAKPEKIERRAFRDEAKRQERAVRGTLEDRRDVDFRNLPGGQLAGQSCPPGLARKSPACMPPGQAKKLGLGDRFQSSWFQAGRIPSWYSSFYPDTQDYFYRYDDNGYIYRVDRDTSLIEAIVPLFGGGFGVGQPLPAGYDVYNVPFQYRDVYADNDDYLYRYGDNAIYRVDSKTNLIESIVALLGGDVVVGQPLPTGYDAYNVPLDYRDRYYDTDESLYRYADGNIFQVDPETMLVQAVVEMLT
jgi:hypothetical protein